MLYIKPGCYMYYFKSIYTLSFLLKVIKVTFCIFVMENCWHIFYVVVVDGQHMRNNTDCVRETGLCVQT